MPTVKIVRTGEKQSLELPDEFRFKTDEVSIRRDEKTGEVILSPRLSWDEVFRLLDEADIPEDFLSPEERNQGYSPQRPLI